MSFFRKAAQTFRAINEGRATAQAHKMAEEFLQQKLPQDVGEAGFERVARIADYSSVEQMAMVYVIVYAERMATYLDAVNATREFREKTARSVARACIILANHQRSGENFDSWTIAELVEAARTLGIKTDGPQISFRT